MIDASGRFPSAAPGRTSLDRRTPLPTTTSASAATDRMVTSEKICGGGILIEAAGLVLLNPDPDQVSADVMALGEPVKGLPGQELLSDLALELDAVRALFDHGFHLSKAQHTPSTC